MEKKDMVSKVPPGKFIAKSPDAEPMDPMTQQLILDLKRHFNGIISAITRWSLAINKEK